MFKFPTANILVVDDSPVIRRLLVASLAKLDITKITQVENAQLALDLLQDQTFDCILLDWEMPVLNGIEFLKLKKEDKKIKDIPVIMITSKGDDPLLPIRLGIQGYIMKPFSESVTLDKVSGILSKSMS